MRDPDSDWLSCTSLRRYRILRHIEALLAVRSSKSITSVCLIRTVVSTPLTAALRLPLVARLPIEKPPYTVTERLYLLQQRRIISYRRRHRCRFVASRHADIIGKKKKSHRGGLMEVTPHQKLPIGAGPCVIPLGPSSSRRASTIQVMREDRGLSSLSGFWVLIMLLYDDGVGRGYSSSIGNLNHCHG